MSVLARRLHAYEWELPQTSTAGSTRRRLHKVRWLLNCGSSWLGRYDKVDERCARSAHLVDLRPKLTSLIITDNHNQSVTFLVGLEQNKQAKALMKSSNLDIDPDTRLAGRTEDGAGSSEAQRRARDLGQSVVAPRTF
jgi:hypothetical protein